MLPNILYLHSHDTGRFISPYGHAFSTPNLQHLAQEGTTFRQMFCAAPSCSPSRAALLTGQCAHSSGMLGLAHRGWTLHDYSQHILHTLRRAGYTSTLCGIQHIAAGPESAKIIGYDEDLQPRSHAQNVAQSAGEWLENRAKSGETAPFFLDVGFIETHTLFEDESTFGRGLGDPRFVRVPPPLPDTPQTRQDFADYSESVKILDGAIGAILAALEKTGFAQNTLVIFTTDHGIPFPAMKCNLTDFGCGVAFIVRGPQTETGQIWNGGQVCDAMLCQSDVFPTLCEFLGIAVPSHVQGTSFLPVLRGETAQIHDEIFAEVTHHAAYEPMRSVRTQRHQYIRRFDGRQTPVLPNCDDSRAKTLWLEHGWKREKSKKNSFSTSFSIRIKPKIWRKIPISHRFWPTCATVCRTGWSARTTRF